MCQCAPGLIIEIGRLKEIGGTLSGCVGDQNHDYGYHLCNPSQNDYSSQGSANNPVGNYACAIDIGMDWNASRRWLAWLIEEIREDRITGIAEVIGSYDGENVRYWSDGSGWQQNGVDYEGAGHDTWTHVSIYRSTAKQDHGILKGWTDNGLVGEGMEQTDKLVYPTNYGDRRVGQAISDVSNLRDWLVGVASSPIGPGGKPVDPKSPLGIILAHCMKTPPTIAEIAAEVVKQLKSAV